MQRIFSALKQYWGYDALRPLQQEAMNSVLSGRDSVTILPTGGGKSLCFQAPALAMEGMAVVVSPLIALMKDQVDALNACGIPAAYINSTITNEQRYATDAAIREGRLKLVYVTPERLAKPAFVDYLRRFNVAFIAIDEAHCISMWGHDFRPEYRQLKQLKERFPGIALHAYTATATPQVREDIVQELSLRQPEVHVGNFDRPNLIYRVQRRSDVMAQIVATVEGHRDEAGVIYCIRRRDTEEVSAMLRARGFRALAYHAGLSDEERVRNQEAFIQEDADIIVATVAFGMGIDKSNVRYVIHAGMPKSLEHYQQESGRAGRDSLEAECLLLYGGDDFLLWQRIIQESEVEGTEVALAKLRDMYAYCNGVTCRHSTIVQYFGQAWDRVSCDACDACLDEIDVMPGAYAVAKTICEAVQGIDQRFGGSYVAKVLRGEKDDRILEYGHDQLRCFGGLSGQRANIIRGWIDQLVGQDFLEKAGEYGVLQLTAQGRLLYCGDPNVKPRLLEPARKAGRKSRSAPAIESWEGVDRGLFEALRVLRRELAHEQGKPPYIIFGDRTLRELARRRPGSVETMLVVHGVGRQKCQAYGAAFVDAIRSYCAMNSLDTDAGVEAPAGLPAVSAGRSRSAAKDHAFMLFRQGESVESVQEETQRAASTVWQYLEDFVAEEGVTDPSAWVPESVVERVQQAHALLGPCKLRPLYEHLEGEVTFEQIRVTLSCLRQREALEVQAE